MSAVKAKKATPTYAARDRDGKFVARQPRPIQGQVDYDALITAAMKQFGKTRSRLAE